MEKNNIADGLNKLIEINNDRTEGYDRAAKETDDSELKALFTKFSSQSRTFKSELENLVRGLGETPIEGTSTSGKFYRAWMDIKAAVSGKDKHAITDSCEFGEDVAKDTYKNILNDLKDVPVNIQNVLQRQNTEIREAHDRIKSMRDSLVS